MTTHSVAFVGTGADPENPDNSGYAMAYHHAAAYERLDDCDLVACADLIPENAVAFAAEHDLPDDRAYEDYERMLTEVDPDVLSVCVPPASHAEVVVDCVRAGDLAAIHCEKPMDLTWGGARVMTQACWRHDVQLTFNHQRRFKPSWVAAREMIEEGEIGEIQRVETAAPNLYDAGTHSLDFVANVTSDQPAKWAIGQIDYREEQVLFGAHNDNQAWGCWEYENGIRGIISTGPGASLAPARFRFEGTEGVLELDPDENWKLRWHRDGEDWREDTINRDGDWTDTLDSAIAHVVDCIGTDQEPTLSARNALNTTEIIFGIWESTRRRGRVDFPLTIDDNPLHDMVESGELTPEPADERDG